ncbi:MAG: hypothetical protein AAF799_37685 [Myxococcota bacterium]
MLYGAIALTIITALWLARSWGSTAGLVFGAINAFIIFVLPLGKILGIVTAGGLLYLLQGGGSKGDGEAAPPAPRDG